MDQIEELKRLASVIRSEIKRGKNTADRIGSYMQLNASIEDLFYKDRFKDIDFTFNRDNILYKLKGTETWNVLVHIPTSGGGGGGGASGDASSIKGIDVDINGLKDGYILSYDARLQKWVVKENSSSVNGVKSIAGVSGDILLSGGSTQSGRINLRIEGNTIVADIIGLKSAAYKEESYFARKEDLNAKYEKPSGGIPKSDLDESVKQSLDKADEALPSVQFTKENIVIKIGGETYHPYGGGNSNDFAAKELKLYSDNGKVVTLKVQDDGSLEVDGGLYSTKFVSAHGKNSEGGGGGGSANARSFIIPTGVTSYSTEQLEGGIFESNSVAMSLYDNLNRIVWTDVQLKETHTGSFYAQVSFRERTNVQYRLVVVG